MHLTVENLWLIYGLVLLVLSILALLAKRNKPETSLGASFAVITFVDLALILLLASAMFDYQTATDDQLNSLNILYWVSGGLFVLALIWAFFEMKKNREALLQSVEVDGVTITVECDENDKCEITDVSHLKSDNKGVHFMSIEKEGKKQAMSPIGEMDIEYLV